MVSLQEVFDEEWKTSRERVAEGTGKVLVFYGNPSAASLDLESLRLAADGGWATLRPEDALQPYGPVLGWLKDWWQKQDYNDRVAFFKDQPKYPYVTQTLLKFLNARQSSRSEPFLSFSTELRTAQRHMVKLLAHLWTLQVRKGQPRTFFIESFHYAPPSLIRLVLEVRQLLGKDCPFFLVLLMERGRDHLLDPLWNQFFEMTEKDSVFLAGFTGGRSEEMTLEVSRHGEAIPLRLAQEAYTWLAFEESRGICRHIQESVGLTLSREDELELHLLLGKTLDCLQDHDNALMVFSQVTSLALQLGVPQSLGQAYLYQSLIYLKKENFIQCQYYLEKIRRLELPDQDTIHLLSEVVRLLLQMAWVNQVDLADMETVLRQLAQKGWKNLTMFLKAQTPYLVQVKKVQGTDAFLKEIRSGYSYCRSIEHLFRMSIFDHVQGMVSQENGQTSRSLRYYRNAIRLRIEFGDLHELTKIYNGTGFVCLQAGLFKRAVGYFTRALEILEQIQDYQEIILTMINLGTAYLLTLDLKNAQLALETVLRLINELNISHLPFHPLSEILGMACWAALWQGQALKAKSYYQLANLTDPQNEEPLLVVLRYCFEHPRSDWDLLAIEEGLKKVTNLDLRVWLQNLDSLVRPEAGTPARPRLPGYRFRTETVLNSARQSLSLARLHQKIHEIQFLNQLQNVIVNTANWQEMIKESMRLIKNSFLISRLYLVMLNELQQKELVFAYPEDNQEPINLWSFDFFSRQAVPSMLLPVERLPPGWQGGAVFSLIQNQQVYGWLICGLLSESARLHDEELKSLQIAVSQISMAVELKRLNERLIRSSTVDPLTGLLNRQEIYRQVSNELRRVKRYKQRNYGPFSLLFIDLDNFKYYNETFGSDLGDQLLKHFGDLLRKVLRDVDTVGRFGSDEFLILLPETNVAGAQVVARRILDELKNRDYFLKEINIYLRKRASIPQNKYLSCSIGITEYNNTTGLDLEELIAVTDNALHEAKHSVKNVMIILPDEHK